MLTEYKSGINSTSIKVSGLSPDSTYLWSVAASDGQTVTRGSIWSFKTKAKTQPVSDEVKNVALSSNGGSATAISEGVYTQKQYAYYANDGDSSTYWASEWSMPAWLEIKFNSVYTIDTVGVWWSSHQQKFSISLSADSSNWTTVVPEQWSTNQEGSSPVHQIFPINATDAKFIKININSTSAPSSHIFQASIGELEAYGYEKTSGIQNQIIEKSISIYPNPTKSGLSIRFKYLSFKNISILLYDSYGKLLTTRHFIQTPSVPVQFYLNGYPAGLYYIQFVTNQGTATKKFIIKR